MADLSAEQRKRAVQLKDLIVKHFRAEHWLDIGAITNCFDTVEGHPRLLRSLDFKDPDYPAAALQILICIAERHNGNLDLVDQYLRDKFPIACALSASSKPQNRKKIVFAPNVFEVPDKPINIRLVAIMMPFSVEFNPVHDAIKVACAEVRLECQRADNIWEHETVIQDIFALIFRSSIVVCDFTGRNPNVFYETGIAHTLGKHVIPITQVHDDVPFDLRHHRYIRYLKNSEGLTVLAADLTSRLRTLAGALSNRYRVGGRVHHAKFGDGVVVAVDDNKITVDFEHSGRKKIVDSFLWPG